MTNATTPVADGTQIGLLLGGVLYGYNLLNDTTGADAMGLVSTNGTILGNLKAIKDSLAASVTITGAITNTSFGAKLQDATGAAFGTSGNPIFVSGGSGGGGGGAVTAVSGAYVAGSIVDLGTGASPGAQTVNGRLAAINTTLGSPLQQTGGTVGITGTVPVSGTFWQATQPISGNVGVTGSVAVTGTFFQATQPVSGTVTIGTALPAGTNAIGSITNTSFASTQSGAWNITNITGTISLPTGAATAAKQPALGTAGSPSTDVLTIQGASAGTPLNVASYAVTATTSFNRPADTTAYVAGDAIADSTTTPTTGGFTLAGMGRATGGSGVITDLIVISADTAALQGEIWIYDSAVTAINDNAAFSVSDSDQLKLVAKVPFALVAEANNAVAHIQNLSIGYTCSASANLRYLLKATGGTLTTVSGNTYTIRAKGVGSN